MIPLTFTFSLSLSPFISLFPLCQIAQLVAAEILSSPFAIHAMRRTDRQLYCTVKGWVRDPPSRKETATHAKSNNGSDKGNGVMGDDSSTSDSKKASAEVRKGKSSAYAYGPYADAPQAIGFKVKMRLLAGSAGFCASINAICSHEYVLNCDLPKPLLSLVPLFTFSFMSLLLLLPNFLCFRPSSSSATIGHHIGATCARESFRPLGITLGRPRLSSAGHWLRLWSVSGVHGKVG